MDNGKRLLSTALGQSVHDEVGDVAALYEKFMPATMVARRTRVLTHGFPRWDQRASTVSGAAGFPASRTRISSA